MTTETKNSLTKIVATLGPSSDNEATIRNMIEAGMSVARINCSHGDWKDRKDRIELIRRLSIEYKRPIGILVDLQGPKIRTGTLPEGGIEIIINETIVLTVDESAADYNASPRKVFIRNYPELPTEVTPGQRILLDDGLLRLEVVSIQDKDVITRVVVGGMLKSNKGVNLPESKQLGLVAITVKDREDIIEAVKVGADFIALSFVRQAADIIELKQLVDAQRPACPIKLIAKIEKPQAMEHLDEILQEVDGVMVARGDLGVELEPEKVPLLQKKIIRDANLSGKFVITATQMMESMINSPFPTRAEVSDVANAILDGTDAVMLSGETAAGSYPVEAVNYMRKVALEVEAGSVISVPQRDIHEGNFTEDEVNYIAIAQSINNFAKIVHIKNIVAFSCSGRSIQRISKLRPKANLIAATTYEHSYRYLSIIWGVTPIYFDRVQRTTQTIMNIEDHLIKEGFIEKGETIVITGGIPIAARSTANFIKVHKCDGSMKEQIKTQEERFKDNLGPSLVNS
ncbi:MAG: pyruvate kinase [Candidatus Melainabacteria bacterium]|jgi:pyruvate kinase|nr:pyruvate kinase [Candidatus Melainabacteria bacterium]